MTIDRTTKFLLLALTLGVWGLLMRAVFTPVEGRAATHGVSTVGMVAMNGSIWVAVPAGHSGSVYRFEGYTAGKPKLLGKYGR